MNAESIRAEVWRLLEVVPFQRFALNMKDGERLVVDDPISIGFEHDSTESADVQDFVVFTDHPIYSYFADILSVTPLEQGHQPNANGSA